MKKRVLALLLCVVCLLSISSLAAQPYAIKIVTFGPVLFFQDGKAICDLEVMGSNDVTSINATMTLKEVNDSGTYTVLGSWPVSVKGNYLLVEKTASADPGKTYILSVSVVVFSPTGNEPKSTTITKTCP